jgi:zinc transport system substrate-binding protein
VPDEGKGFTPFRAGWLFFAVSAFAAACNPGTAEKIDHGLVMATVRPYALVAEEIVSPRLRVETLLPPQASPHTWSPRPEDLERLAKAGVIIVGGLGLEARLGSSLDRFAARTLNVAAFLGLEDDNALPPSRRSYIEREYDDIVRRDPHLWGDPSLMIRFAGIIAEHFAAIDPEGAPAYLANYRRFTGRVQSMDRHIRDQAGAYRHRSLLTFNDGFIRFFERYGIQRVAADIPAHGGEFPPGSLAELDGLIRARRVQAIYSEPQLDIKSVQNLAARYDLPVYMLDPLGMHGGITNYSSFLLFNWEQMRRGFIQ